MGSWKIERELDHRAESGGLPQFLRELAEALESGPGDGLAGGVFDGLPVRDWRKLVLVAERRGAGLTLKFKAKRASEVRVPTASKAGKKDTPGAVSKETPRDKDKVQAAREKYRQLKKTLQADFKALRAAVDEGRLPDAETLESFLSLAELMGQGELPLSGAALTEMARSNTMFLDDCQALRRACSARDAAALAAVLERLARRKSACHAQFR
ncbi:MAG: GAK system XXXCH domain-containing protein [Humidesulfovibrio sp.]|nr:GAK system XXXCH domain-containing protein [Humidesulfovibrio sp.]